MSSRPSGSAPTTPIAPRTTIRESSSGYKTKSLSISERDRVRRAGSIIGHQFEGFDSTLSILEGPLEKKQVKSNLDKLDGASGRWGTRYFRLYTELLAWFAKEEKKAPDGMLPLETIVYVVHLSKESKGVMEDPRRFDVVVKGKEMWTFEFRATSEHEAAHWVQTLKEQVAKANEAAKSQKEAKLSYDTTGKFWKKVRQISITYQRRAEVMSRKSVKRTSAVHRIIKSGALKKKSQKLGIWQARECTLYPDVLIYRTKGADDASGAIALWNVSKVEGPVKAVFTLLVQMEESKSMRPFEFRSESDEEAEAWVAALKTALEDNGPETAEEKAKRLTALGDSEFLKHDYPLAIEYYRQAMEIDLENRDLRSKWRKACGLNVKKMPEPTNPQSLALKLEGNDYFQTREWKKACDCYDKAIELDSNNSLLYFNRAAALLSLGENVAAISDARRAVELDPQSAQAHTRLGVTLYKLGRYDDAIETYKEALKLDPSDERAEKGIGLAMGKLKEIEEARKLGKPIPRPSARSSPRNSLSPSTPSSPPSPSSVSSSTSGLPTSSSLDLSSSSSLLTDLSTASTTSTDSSTLSSLMINILPPPPPPDTEEYPDAPPPEDDETSLSSSESTS